MVTLCLSPWILGLTFLGLPRLAQAQDVSSGTTIYGTNQAATNWTGGTIDSGATLRLDDGGTVSVFANVTNDGTLQYNASGNLAISNTVTGTGTLLLTGSGILMLTGNNTYTGETTVSTGVLNIQHANALGTIAAGTNVTSGAALQIEGGITTAAEALTLNGTGVNAAGALHNISGDNTYAGLVTLGEATRINSDAGTLTLNNTSRIQASGSGIGLTVGGAGNTTIAGIDTGSGSTLTKDGAGTLTLTQSSGFSDGLAVNAGTVRLLTSNFYALNSSGEVSIASGAVLTADQTVNNHHHIGGVTLNGGTLTSINGPAGPANDGSAYGIFFLQGGVAVGGSSMSTISATTVGFNNGSFNVGDVAVGTDLLVSSHLVPSGGGSLIKTGDGTMTLTGANTYTTATTISAGTLQIGAGGTTGSLSASSAITNNGTLSFNRSNTITQGTDFHSEISGTGAVTQTGNGTLVLSGTNTYSGATTVSAGTLEVSGASGALTNTSGVNIHGGTLLLTDVSDRINHADAAVISLGATTGDSMLRLSGNVTEALGAMTLSGGNADRRVIDFGSGSGNLSMENLTGSSSQGLEIWNWTDGTDHLYVNSGSLWGGLTTSTISFFSDQGSGLVGTAQFTSSGELVPVPEASTLLAVLGLMAPLAWRERRHWMRCREARGN
jgi:autotransporter-associated beta strand protein